MCGLTRASTGQLRCRLCPTPFASHSKEGQGVPPFGNRLTHVQVVRANCGDHVCVTLFSPSLWFCGTWFRAAVEQQLNGLTKARVDPKVARGAIDAVQKPDGSY